MTGKDKQHDEEATIRDVHTEGEETEQAKQDKKADESWEELLANPEFREWWEKNKKSAQQPQEAKLAVCSFCGKDQTKVQGLITGPFHVYICNECVDAAGAVLSRAKEQAFSSALRAAFNATVELSERSQNIIAARIHETIAELLYGEVYKEIEDQTEEVEDEYGELSREDREFIASIDEEWLRRIVLTAKVMHLSDGSQRTLASLMREVLKEQDEARADPDKSGRMEAMRRYMAYCKDDKGGHSFSDFYAGYKAGKDKAEEQEDIEELDDEDRVTIEEALKAAQECDAGLRSPGDGKEPAITESSGNVFADLGMPDAAERFAAAQRYITQYKAAEEAKKAQRLHYAMTILWSQEDQCYLVQLPEWAAHLLNYKTATHGETYEEAAKNGREVLEMLMEGAVKAGERIPEPLVWTKEDQESEDRWDKLFASPESQADMAKQGRQAKEDDEELGSSVSDVEVELRVMRTLICRAIRMARVPDVTNREIYGLVEAIEEAAKGLMDMKWDRNASEAKQESSELNPAINQAAIESASDILRNAGKAINEALARGETLQEIAARVAAKSVQMAGEFQASYSNDEKQGEDGEDKESDG